MTKHPHCPQIEDQYLKIRQNSKQFNQNEKSFEKIQKSKPNKYKYANIND